MKKVYMKPELDAKAYAQFENVFTECTKGNAIPQGCTSYVDWTPSEPTEAAYKIQSSI
ncbi:hypothetical protein [Phosphitispora sp. TUW77]|uniref:hypothetical protein n=1 Tax=Phosphitispora sp. TUW77 TaxID=3152361 RepID=UPI003AB87C96